jgi:dienelactone hydrolase
MMFPSLRGGNDNPGRREGFLGEVDDVLAAREYLAAQPYVDLSRIYLGGHSTGGTLAMLVAETTDRFRAVFAFGPVDDVRTYGGDFVYHVPSDTEAKLRGPIYWLNSVHAPLFVIEGASGISNAVPLRQMKAKNSNSQIQFIEVPGVTHFSILAAANEAIAKKILADDSSSSGIQLTADELQRG